MVKFFTQFTEVQKGDLVFFRARNLCPCRIVAPETAFLHNFLQNGNGGVPRILRGIKPELHVLVVAIGSNIGSRNGLGLLRSFPDRKQEKREAKPIYHACLQISGMGGAPNSRLSGGLLLKNFCILLTGFSIFTPCRLI